MLLTRSHLDLILRIICAGFLVFLGSQCQNKKEKAVQEEQEVIQALVRDEEAVLEVTTLAIRIADAIDNKEIVSAQNQSLFANKVSISGLFVKENNPSNLDEMNGITESQWIEGERQTLSLDSVPQAGVWKEVFDTLDEVSDASFGFITGKSKDDDLLESLLKFSAKGVDHHQNRVGLKGQVAVDWVKSGDSWKIKSWHTKSITVMRRKDLLFKNRMDEIFGSADHPLATRSFHEEKLTEYIEKEETMLPKTEYWPYFMPESGYQHPAVSVVDINQDGWDDLFVTSLWAPCQLWINHEGKHFTEEAHQFGLIATACCTSAIFADFDNDGDPDLFLGRSLESSQIFWNENGYFVPSPLQLPYLVTSVSAADCNNDGLLDLYLCTYGPSGTAAQKNPAWIKTFLPPNTHSSLNTALASGHRYFDQAGPRNFLLLNRGKRLFEAIPPNAALDQYHNSYQGSWADYDKDGDSDLYVCNDFAPDSLLRNDGWGKDGIPRFTDISKEVSGDTMKGFGMGASWGDYNNDQQPDLFVTNMYSKAGKRVLSRFDNVDDRLHFSARGNLIFRQEGGRFEQLAGESDSFPVDQGGWAFGGQFIDVDNDAWLDLYVPNGFYTAPKRVASQVDL